jgi:hypothetical protein
MTNLPDDERRRLREAWAMTYTVQALVALHRAVLCERDFSGWLAGILALVAAMEGSSDALTAGRPGSWEASLVDQLVKGTVGYHDEYLETFPQARAPRPGP